MAIACPDCGSKKLRLSKSRGLVEAVGTILGIYPMKCAECQVRFHGRITNLPHLIFAKCPRCHKMDLAKWSDHHYHAPFSLRLKIMLGATRRRCVYCRYNFASWRPLKERYDPQKRAGRSQVRVQVSKPDTVEKEHFDMHANTRGNKS